MEPAQLVEDDGQMADVLCVQRAGLVAAELRLDHGHVAVPHKDFSDLYGKVSGEGASASEAHR